MTGNIERDASRAAQSLASAEMVQKSVRHLIAEAVELLILAIDEMEPDVDLEPDVDDEPNLARTVDGSCGGCCDDRELDTDDEPSLGALEDHAGSQANWAGKGYDRGDDREGDRADDEPDHDPDHRDLPLAPASHR